MGWREVAKMFGGLEKSVKKCRIKKKFNYMGDKSVLVKKMGLCKNCATPYSSWISCAIGGTASLMVVSILIQ